MSTTMQLQDALEELMADLPERSREIVRNRFGVGHKAPWTLQAIGSQHGITRERVRQIVHGGIDSVRGRQDHPTYKSVVARIEEIIAENSGIMPAADLIDSISKNDLHERGAVRFFVTSFDEFNEIDKKDKGPLVHVVTNRHFDLDEWHAIHDAVKDILAEEERVHMPEEIYTKLESRNVAVAQDRLGHYLRASREIDQNPFGKWGRTTWDEITPRGIREKVFLVLEEYGKPMHFADIAQAIDEHGLGRLHRKTHPQTVHNELIKDKRFMLVGRGVYALTSWGYASGTVADLIRALLTKRPEGIVAADVVDAIQKQRDVKKATIMINLNKIAQKDREGRYTLPQTVA